MQITLTDYATGKLIASRKVTPSKFGYVYRGVPKTWFDEFEQALYALNNGEPDGVIADNWSDDYKTPVNPYMRFAMRSEMGDSDE
jgi:hypothetical protein